MLCTALCCWCTESHQSEGSRQPKQPNETVNFSSFNFLHRNETSGKKEEKLWRLLCVMCAFFFPCWDGWRRTAPTPPGFTSVRSMRPWTTDVPHTRTLSHSRMRPSIRPSVVILSVSCALALSVGGFVHFSIQALTYVCVRVFAPVD